MADPAALAQLWDLIEVLLGTHARSNATARATLKHAALAPGWDGGIWPIDEVYDADQELQDLLADLDVDITFLDIEQLPDGLPRFREQIEQAGPEVILEGVEAATAERPPDPTVAQRLLQ